MGKIAFLGDSITKGTDYGGVTSGQTFASLIGTRSGYLSGEVINAGVGGSTSDSALARLQSDVISPGAKVCVVMLGNNDASSTSGISAGRFEANVREILAELCLAGIRPVLFSMGLERGDISLFKRYQPYLEALDSISREAAVPYVDVYREFTRSYLCCSPAEWNGLFADALHLSAAGHQYVATIAGRRQFGGVFNTWPS